jgi:hypothetical protein
MAISTDCVSFPFFCRLLFGRQIETRLISKRHLPLNYRHTKEKWLRNAFSQRLILIASQYSCHVLAALHRIGYKLGKFSEQASPYPKSDNRKGRYFQFRLKLGLPLYNSLSWGEV